MIYPLANLGPGPMRNDKEGGQKMEERKKILAALKAIDENIEVLKWNLNGLNEEERAIFLEYGPQLEEAFGQLWAAVIGE